MGTTPGYHHAHTVAPAFPVATETGSTAATLVVRVTYRAASNSVLEGVNNQIKTLIRHATRRLLLPATIP